MTDVPLWRKIVAGVAAWVSAAWLLGVVKLVVENIGLNSIPHPVPVLLLGVLGLGAAVLARKLWPGWLRVFSIGLAASALFYLLTNLRAPSEDLALSRTLFVVGVGIAGSALAFRRHQALATVNEGGT